MDRGRRIIPHSHNKKSDRKIIKRKIRKKKIPINLLRKARREQRNRNERPEKKPRNPKISKPDPVDVLVQKTQMELKRILARTEALSDINYDCTPEELIGEIALAEGNGTIIYIEREGLSTLTIVLPQEAPTIANLKRAIESAARVQLQREQRQRYEERLERRARATTVTLPSKISENSSDRNETEANDPSTNMGLEPQIRSTGELVCSTAHNGHQHRSNVSWRFLWRAYMLFHIERNQPIEDSNGRKLLSDCGIENATTLKFCKREKYFGRKRQK